MTRLKTDAFVSLRRPNRLRRPHARREDARARARPARGPARTQPPGLEPRGQPPGLARRGRVALAAGLVALRRLQPRREDSLAARGGARGSSLSGVRGRPATGFGASRHEEPSEFGASGDDFGSDGHAGDPAGPQRRRCRRRRRRGNSRRGDAGSGRWGGGCGTEHGIRTGIWGFGCFQGKRRGLCEANGSRAALAPDGARGFQRPRPPAQPRPTSGPAGLTARFARTRFSREPRRLQPRGTGASPRRRLTPRGTGTRTGSARSRRRRRLRRRIVRAISTRSRLSTSLGSKP